MATMKIKTSTQYGAISIFIVIFTALLITVVTVSFVRLMVREQQRASDSDLSQSAYDSALAGVEDAKRALTKYYQQTGARLNLNDCNAIKRVLYGGTDTSEVQVQTTTGDSVLAQAYTCVKVNVNPIDYVRSLDPDRSVLVPLRATGQFDRVKIEWFSKEDVSGRTTVNVPASGSTSVLSQSWPADRPSVLQTQLIQTASSFNLDNFDNTSNGNSNTNTLFLYPKQLAADAMVSFTQDARRSPTNAPTDTRCRPNIASLLYSCTAFLTLPNPIGGTPANRTNAFLRLVARYNKTDVRVTMYNGDFTGNPVPFNETQAVVDSTGRANDLFRRVSARVEADANIPYPEAAVDITGNFCKTFSVTDSANQYVPGACTP